MKVSGPITMLRFSITLHAPASTHLLNALRLSTEPQADLSAVVIASWSTIRGGLEEFHSEVWKQTAPNMWRNIPRKK